MSSGKAYGPDREYQVFCRDFLIERSFPLRLVACEGDGIDVPFLLGSGNCALSRTPFTHEGRPRRRLC